MKILSFDKPDLGNTNYSKMVDIILNKGIPNDEVLEKVYFDFIIENDHPIMFFYRLLWEHRYLRRRSNGYSTTIGIETNPTRYKYRVKVSISELIGFFHQIVPPLFASRVKELYNSIESICDSIRLFIFEADDVAYNTSVFQKCIGWNRFDTNMEYDIKRTNVLRNNVPDGIVCDIEMNTCDIKDIYDGKISYNTNDEDVDGLYEKVQLMFSCVRKDDLFELASIIESSSLSILNVSVAQDFYFIEAMTYDYNTSEMQKLQNIIERSYKPLFN